MKSKKASPLKRAFLATLVLSLSLTVAWPVTGHAATTVTFGDNTGDDFPGTVEDALIFERSGYDDFNYGAMAALHVGDPADTARTRRTLIRFKDIASSLPPDMVITSATMYLHCKNENSISDHVVSAYRVLLNWVEGTENAVIQEGSCCWNHAQYTGLPWNTVGCDAASDMADEDSTADSTVTAEASTLVTGTGWFTWDLTNAVQNWYNDNWSEYGVILISDDEGTSNSMKIFNSKESTTDGHRPRLAVTYEEVPAPYNGPAHNDPTNGVDRSATEYAVGDCADCHDTFGASTCSVNHRMLFNSEFTNQKSGVCMKCHRETDSHQEGGVLNNYDYSRVRGGETTKDCPASIRTQFWFLKYDTRLPRNYCDTVNLTGSAHDLKNIRAYMKNKWRWGGVNEEVNPCGACHNPHKATKDFPCSLPSGHENTWELWGGGIGEKMIDYLGADEVYQPPHKVGGGFERNAVTQPDYNTLCLECHQYEQSSEQHGTIIAIDWESDARNTRHGRGVADTTWMKPPYEYNAGTVGKYVLCCTDCHEPHGSRNERLLRTAVNGLGGIELDNIDHHDWRALCESCHNDNGHFSTGTCGGGCHGHGTGLLF
jgi:hypothetical protein